MLRLNIFVKDAFNYIFFLRTDENSLISEIYMKRDPDWFFIRKIYELIFF